MEKEGIKDWVKKNLNGWLDENSIETIFNDDKLIECINECTSPKNNPGEPINKEDLKLIFNAFSLFKPEETKVLILGQDPYPDNDKYKLKRYGKRAHGLAFSFQNGQEPADDSLLNIFKAIDIYKNPKETGDIYKWNTNLENWAKKNKILLLNVSLTHEKCNLLKKIENKDIETLSKENKKSIKKEQDKLFRMHKNTWSSFIEQIISNVIKKNNKLAIFLWGAPAQNSFLQCLNTYKDDEEIQSISNKIKEVLENIISLNKRSKNFNRSQKTIKWLEPIEIKPEIKIYMTTHPSPISENNEGKFIEYSSKKHFKDCDEFLGKIESKCFWKGFPENNQ